MCAKCWVLHDISFWDTLLIQTLDSEHPNVRTSEDCCFSIFTYLKLGVLYYIVLLLPNKTKPEFKFRSPKSLLANFCFFRAKLAWLSICRVVIVNFQTLFLLTSLKNWRIFLHFHTAVGNFFGKPIPYSWSTVFFLPFYSSLHLLY